MRTGFLSDNIRILHLKGLRAEWLLPFLVVVLLCCCAVSASSWQSIGPSGGDFLGSVSDPADASKLITITTGPLYSNVYKSVNGGSTWDRLSRITASNAQDMCAFDFNTLFVLTSNGCHRSDDAGGNWTYAPFNQPYSYAYAVAVDPADSQKVYAAGLKYDYDDGLYNFVFFKSADGGQTWDAQSFFKFEYFYPTCIAIPEINPSVIYVGGYKYESLYYSGALFKSTDAGDSWTDISDSFAPYHDRPMVYSIAIDPADQNQLYLAAGYVYRSADAGVNWTRSPTYFGAFDIGIDPVDTSNIYVSAYNNVFVSSDYAQSFTPYYGCISGYARNIEVAPANPSTIYVSSILGFFKSIDSGKTWFTAHNGINATVIPAFAVAKSRPQTLVIEDYGVNVMLSHDSGQSWSEAGYFGDCGVIADIVINPQQANIVLAIEGDG